MKFLLVLAATAFMGNVWAFDAMICNVNLMTFEKGQFIRAGNSIFNTVATKTFSQSHGAIMNASSAVVLFDETVIPLDRKGNPVKNAKKEEVVISIGNVMKSWENDESFTIALFRESEKNKYDVRTKIEKLGQFEFKEMGKSEVVFIDKYAVQVSCNIVAKP